MPTLEEGIPSRLPSLLDSHEENRHDPGDKAPDCDHEPNGKRGLWFRPEVSDAEVVRKKEGKGHRGQAPNDERQQSKNPEGTSVNQYRWRIEGDRQKESQPKGPVNYTGHDELVFVTRECSRRLECTPEVSIRSRLRRYSASWGVVIPGELRQGPKLLARNDRDTQRTAINRRQNRAAERREPAS